MFIKKIRLRHFKCIDALELGFEPTADSKLPVRKNTIFVGQNGTGKTAILQALALITAGEDTLRKTPFLPEDFIQNKKHSCEIEAVFFADSGEELMLSLRMQQGQSQTDFLKKNALSLGEFKKAIRITGDEFFIAGYGALRQTIARAFASSKINLRQQAIGSLLGNRTSLQALDFVAQEFHSKGGQTGGRHLRETLNAFLPPELSCKGFSTAKGKLQFDTPDGLLSQEHLALGWQVWLNWLADFAFHASQKSSFKKHPFSARGILLFDEPDLHLHPLWQRQILPLLNHHLPDMQIIAGSHSPLCAQQAGRDELYALYRNDARQVKLLPFVGKPFRMLPHQLLMSPMFGLETDDSVKVEAEKVALRQAAMNSGKAGSRKNRNIPEAEGPLGVAPVREAGSAESNRINVRGNSSTEPEDLALLRQIHEALQQNIPHKPEKQ